MSAKKEEMSRYVEEMTQRCQKRTSEAQAAIVLWNKLYPIGTNVRATRRDGTQWKTSTRTVANLAYEEAMIYLKGEGVAYSLSNVRPLRRKKLTNGEDSSS